MNAYQSATAAYTSPCTCCVYTRHYAALLRTGGYAMVTMQGVYKLRAHGPDGVLAYGHRDVVALLAGKLANAITVEAESLCLTAGAA